MISISVLGVDGLIHLVFSFSGCFSYLPGALCGFGLDWTDHGCEGRSILAWAWLWLDDSYGYPFYRTHDIITSSRNT